MWLGSLCGCCGVFLIGDSIVFVVFWGGILLDFFPDWLAGV